MRSYKIEAVPPISAGMGEGGGARRGGRQENTDITAQIIENTKTGRLGVK